MYIEKATAKERCTVSDAVDPIFVDLERAESLLNEIREDCFEFKDSKPVCCGDAGWMFDMLSIVSDIMYDAIASFHLTIGDMDNYHAEYYLKCLRLAESAAKCESVLDRIYRLESRLPVEERKKVTDSVKASSDLDNEEALPVLEKLLSEMDAQR